MKKPGLCPIDRGPGFKFDRPERRYFRTTIFLVCEKLFVTSR
jgi:hypothetical protein